MAPSLVILTGASGSGKTTLARAIQQACPSHCKVLLFDSVGVPSVETMRAFGDGHQPGGAWQRATTLQWMERIAVKRRAGISVLFEGQMRIAFIHEALAVSGIEGATSSSWTAKTRRVVQGCTTTAINPSSPMRT